MKKILGLLFLVLVVAVGIYFLPAESFFNEQQANNDREFIVLMLVGVFLFMGIALVCLVQGYFPGLIFLSLLSLVMLYGAINTAKNPTSVHASANPSTVMVEEDLFLIL